MRITAIYNRDGGTFRTTDMEGFAEHTREAFARHGHEIDVRVVAGADLCPGLDAALQGTRRPDALIAGGGDGTISAAAGRCWKAGVPLGVLPAGTMNLFARSLAMPLDVREAVDTLAAGEVRAVDIATANGIPFIHQFSIGLHARMVQMRDQMEFRSRAGKVIASTRALVATLFDPPAFPMNFRLGANEGKAAMVSTVSVSNNLFGEGHLPYADDPAGGVLGFYFHPELTVTEGFSFVWKAARGRLSEIENLEISAADRIELAFPRHRRSARAIIDGEVHRLARKVEVVSHRRDLKVLAPRRGAQD